MLDSVRLWCFSAAILKCDIKMNSGVNNYSGIQFADQENIIIVSNIVQVQPHTTRAQMKLLPVFGRHLEFQDERVTSEVWHRVR